MKITIKNKLFLQDIPGSLGKTIKSRLTFANPKYLENERMGRWNGEIPEYLRFYEESRGSLIVPRGYIRQLINLCRQNNVRLQLIDQRRLLPEVSFTFNGMLRPFQEEAVETMLEKDFGTLSAPTGSGKTIMALYIIAQRKQPAMIVVHTKELLNQWVDRIETFLNIPKDQIGIIGAGKKKIGDKITVALVQTLYKCTCDVSQHIGHLAVDESHRAPSRTFTEAVTAFDSKYMLGLSATPWRRDKLSKLIFWHLGDVHYEIDKEDLQDTGDILKAEVVTRETDFIPYNDATFEYSKVLSELTQNEQRNSLICGDVVTASRNGSGICLVLSNRKDHCADIQSALLRDFDVIAEVLTGDIPQKKRQDIVDRLNDGKIKVLIATGQLIGEGFDCKELSTLFLATPISFDGRVLQYLGRVLRPAPSKDKATIFDYIDVNVPVLVASAKAREKIYNI